MLKYWLKNRFIISLLCSCALLSVVVLLFLFPYLERSLDEYNNLSAYTNTGIDFDVPEPSVEQAENLKNEPSISKVYPYYLDEQPVSVNNKTRRTNIIIADFFGGEFAMYNTSRLIEKSDRAIISNQAFIDFEFQKATGAKPGDIISFSILDTPMTYVIAAVYETNTRFLNSGAIAVNIDSRLKDIIGNERAYSGAFIAASDYSQCYSFLKYNYRPLGRLRDRSKFDTDEAYDRHVATITDRSYEKEIVFFRERVPNQTVDTIHRVGYYLSFFSLMFGGVIINLLLFNRKSEKEYWKSYIISGGNPKKYYWVSTVFDLVANCGVLLLLFEFCQRALYSDYFAPSITKNVLIYMLGAVCLLFVINLVLNNMWVKRLIKRGNSYAAEYDNTK